MAMQSEIKAFSIDKQAEAGIIESITESIEAEWQEKPQLSQSARIHRVPEEWEELSNIQRYYVPKIVSIGPYHHGNQMLELVEKHKPLFTKKLLSESHVSLKSLCQKLGEANMVQELRNFYKEKSTDHFSDENFIKMMLLDGCFILYYIQFLYQGKRRTRGVLRSQHIVLIQEDLFLLENQIPFKVLNQVMNVIGCGTDMIDSFITETILGQGRQKRGCNGSGTYSTQNEEKDHLLHCLYYNLTRSSINKEMIEPTRTFHNINELIDMGIHLKPSTSMDFANVEFVRRCWWFSADLKLLPITMERLLNLLAYEMCLGDGHNAWAISYVCLLDSLIDQPQDVKALWNAGVLDNGPLGNESEKDVARIIKEIGMDLVPNNKAYLTVKNEIQNHYKIWTRTYLIELRRYYIKSPWSFLAILGGVMVLFLSGVQTYFTVWSPKSECDGLCTFLKKNHHL